MSFKSRPQVTQTTPTGSSALNKRVCDFSWADDVENTLYQDVNGPSISKERALSVAYATGAHIATIEGIKYKHHANAPAIFSPEDPDRRYIYENPPLPDEISPISETFDEPELNDVSNAPPVVYVPAKTHKKKHKRRKADPLRGPQTTPSNTRSDTFAEMMAAQDDFCRNLPHASQVLVPVNPMPPTIVEDLWADYNRKPAIPIYQG